MSILQALNSAPLYLICGGIIAFVAVICIVFLLRAYRAGIAIGMDKSKLRTVITSSATFSILPSVGILLGVIALSGSLGIPWPWLRLSVIGALHYETQVAQAAAEQVGLSSLSAAEMTPQAFSTIALLMSICIMWGMILTIIFNKSYLKKLSGKPGKTQEIAPQLDKDVVAKKEKGSFADKAMTAMFIGLVSAYVASYIGTFVSGGAQNGGGLFKFRGDWVPLVVVATSALSMAGFIWLSQKKKMAWVDSFSIAGSMIIGMASAIVASL